MSATELIAEIKKLPRQEREVVVFFVSHNQTALLAPEMDDGPKVSFEEAAKSVFTKHHDLLHKLAQ